MMIEKVEAILDLIETILHGNEAEKKNAEVELKNIFENFSNTIKNNDKVVLTGHSNGEDIEISELSQLDIIKKTLRAVLNKLTK